MYNKEITTRYAEPENVWEIKRKRLRWISNLQINDDIVTTIVWKNQPEGHRSKRRPKTRWKDCIKDNMEVKFQWKRHTRPIQEEKRCCQLGYE